MLLFAPAELYVSVQGNDSDAGTATAPLRTLSRAVQIARQRKSSRIIVSRGEYELRASIQLTAADSGLTIEAASGERPLITGAVSIPQFAITQTRDQALLRQIIDPAARPRIREINLRQFIRGEIAPAAPYGFPQPKIPTGNELFSDAAPFISARWPNEGYAKVEQVIEAGNGEADREAPKRQPIFISNPDRVKKWAKSADVWFYGYWKYDWADESIPAANIDATTGAVTLRTPHTYGVDKGVPFYAENLLPELDQAGEMFIDRKGGKLYFIPKAGSTSNYRLSLLAEPLVQIQGGSKITLRGLDFGFSRADGVHIQNGTDVRLEGCQFYNLGMRAAVIDGGKNTGLYGCNIWNTGEGGVALNGGDRNTLTAAGNYVENCDIHHFQRRTQTYRPAVSISGVGNRVVHCSMHDAPHAAIIFSGNEHLIEFNEFYRNISRTGDGGVVYTGRDWTARGTQILYNHFYDNIGIRKWESNIYFDDLASGLIAKGNLIERCHYGMVLGGGQDYQIEDNVFVDTKLAFFSDARGLGWYAENKPTMVKRLEDVPYKSGVWARRYPQLLTMMANEPMAPKRNVLRGNLLVRSGSLFDQTEPGFKKLATFERNNESKASGSWRQARGAPVLPVDKMGMVMDQVRATLPK